MRIRCPTCGKLVDLNFETVSILGNVLSKIDYDNEDITIPTVFYCNECGENLNMNLVYKINLKDSYFTKTTKNEGKYEFGGKND